MSGYLTRPADRVVHRDDRALILGVESVTCHYCGEPNPGHVDHLVPSARGGVSAQVNYVPACSLCNQEKRNLSVEQWQHWRAGQGRCWPPRGRRPAGNALVEALGTITDPRVTEARSLLAEALRPAPPSRSMRDWPRDWVRRVHRGHDRPIADELAGLLAAAS